MAAAELPFPVLDGILDAFIEEGTHASLHALVNITMKAGMGMANQAGMRGAITLAKQARLRAVYATGHFANQIAVAATAAASPVIPAAIPLTNAPLNPAEFPLICQCTQCFAFLCTFKGGVISVSGFTETRRSYLYQALDVAGVEAPGVNVAVGIIQRLPDAHLELPQRFAGGRRPWPNASHIFGIAASRARPTKAYLKRIHALHLAVPPANPVDYSERINWSQMTDMAYWVDINTAVSLLSWNINISRLKPATHGGTMFHQVIIQRNPYRYTLLPWLEQNACPGIVDCNTLRFFQPDPAAPGFIWPPVSVAMYLGDSVSLRSLATITTCNFNLLTPAPGAAPNIFTMTVGVAGPTALTWNAHNTFKEWLSYASPVMEEAGQSSRITDILNATIKKCSEKRVAIKAEPLPAGTLIAQHNRSKTRRRKIALDVALAFIYTIQEESFSTLRFEPDGTTTTVKMYETDWYKRWLIGFKSANRNPATRTCRDVVPLINALDRTTNRITRSGRNVSDRR